MKDHLSDDILKEITTLTQFPYGARAYQYQSFMGANGSRNMDHRFEVMKFPKRLDGQTVLDIGCNLGVVCVEAKKRGATRVVGIDYRTETIKVAKKVAKELGLDIEFYTFDVNKGLKELNNIIGVDKFDNVMTLSIWGHVNKGKLAKIVNYYTRGICWFEGHGSRSQKGLKATVEKKIFPLLKYKSFEHLGFSKDRGNRINSKLFYCENITIDCEQKIITLNKKEFNILDFGQRQQRQALLKANKLSEKTATTERLFQGVYCVKSKWSLFFGDQKNDEAYKIFFSNAIKLKNLCKALPKLISTIEIATKVFKIQKILSDINLSVEPICIVTFYYDEKFYYGIKTKRAIGKFLHPDDKFMKIFKKACRKNNIKRKGRIDKGFFNFIKTDDGIMMIDIDCGWCKGSK